VIPEPQAPISSNQGFPSKRDGTRQTDWFQQWSLADDVGTEYHQTGAGRGGDGFCSDVDVQFRAAVPAEATRLSITAPGGHRIEVAL
jgi:hypothetical protein